MPHNKEQLLYDIIEGIKTIEVFAKNKSFEEFDNERLLQAGVERELEIIGEALNRLNRLDPSIAEQITEVHRIIGMRNILAHGYDVIENQIIWKVIKDKLGKLKSEAEGLF